jgi:hypothetical protein
MGYWRRETALIRVRQLLPLLREVEERAGEEEAHY